MNMHDVSFLQHCAPQSERVPRQWEKKRRIDTRAWEGQPHHRSIEARHTHKEPVLPDPHESFRTLFDQFRGGESLIPSEEMRALAKRAVDASATPVSDIDEWAKRLADDTGGAHD